MDIKTLEENFLGKKHYESDMAPRDMRVKQNYLNCFVMIVIKHFF